jgi:hypothetical protein
VWCSFFSKDLKMPVPFRRRLWVVCGFVVTLATPAALVVPASRVRIGRSDLSTVAGRTDDGRTSSGGAELIQAYLRRAPNLTADAANQCRSSWMHTFSIDAVAVGVGKLACCTGCATGVMNTRLNDTQRLAAHVKKSPRVGNMWGFPLGTTAAAAVGVRAGNEDAQRGMTVLCTKKTGVTMWNRFLFKVYTSVGAVQPKWLNDERYLDQTDPLRSIQSLPGTPMLLITRNPYSRFLSALLDKGPQPEQLAQINEVLASHGYKPFELSPTKQKGSADKHSRSWKHLITPLIFRIIVEVLHKQFVKQDHSWGFPGPEMQPRVLSSPLVANPHFWPQTSIVLQLQAHCPVDLRDQIIVLKNENEPKWFLCLMRALGVKLSDLATGFRGVRREDENYSPWPSEDCFWHPSGATCDWLAANWNQPGTPIAGTGGRDADGGHIGGGGGGGAAPPTEGDLHNHGAGALITTFYDPVSAARIAAIYRADFELLGYPPWDGGAEPPLT